MEQKKRIKIPGENYEVTLSFQKCMQNTVENKNKNNYVKWKNAKQEQMETKNQKKNNNNKMKNWK